MSNTIIAKGVSLYNFWENLYMEGRDSWSHSSVSPALLEFFKHPMYPKKGDVLVPAAGKGLDADAWAKRGHKVLAVDFCPSAIDSIERLADGNNNLSSLNLDIFLLSPQDEKRGGRQFDIIYDSCSFNSIHPKRRDEYIEVLLKMLKDKGIFIGFFFPFVNEESRIPPYNISKEELEARFNGILKIEKKIVPQNSFESRKGKEEIWLMKKF
jgi:phospholipid N-methyltransferase